MAISHLRSSSLSQFRTGEALIGVKDSANIIYDSPEPFVFDLNGGFYFEFLRNGQLQILGTQYSILLSTEGYGVGIKVFRAPRPNDTLVINYIKA